jgi:branched-chain amino acid transport system permease protein
VRAIWVACLGALALALLFLPRASSSYELVLATRILIFAIFAMSLDLLVGYTGLSSLGHAAFFGIAGYAVGLMSKNVTANFAVTFPTAIITSAALAAVFGALVLRSKGVYFMMLTLALAQVVWGIAFQWRSVTGGDDGLPGIPRPVIAGVQISDSHGFYLFTLIIFAISATALILVVRSPFGLTLRGMRESDARMSALGYQVKLHQFIAFVIAGAFAGVAGALLAWQNGITTPASLSIITGAEALLMVLLGGAGTMIGPIIGAVVVVLLEYMVSARTDRWQSVLGLIYILVVIAAPSGVYPPMRDGWLKVWQGVTTRLFGTRELGGA